MTRLRTLNQGECDYFCCLYSIINAIPQMNEKKIGYKSQIYVFNRLLEKLAAIGGLKNIEKNGVSHTKASQLIKTAQKILSDKYQIQTTVEQPFHKQQLDVISLETFLRNKNTAIILSISENGGMKHWTVIDKIKGKELFLRDSWIYKKLNLKNIPWPYKLDDVFIMRVQTDHTANTQNKKCAD